MPTKRSTKARTVEVEFSLPADVEADEVALCGEFNEWSPTATTLLRDSDGRWVTKVALEPNRSYRYRYLIDGHRWENAWDADSYVNNPFGGDDSVIVVLG